MSEIVFAMQINLRIYIRTLKDFHELKRKIIGLYYFFKQVDYSKEGREPRPGQQ
jgi:hypothetical protein